VGWQLISAVLVQRAQELGYGTRAGSHPDPTVTACT